MKKVYVLLTSILIFSLIAFLFSSTATTQTANDLTGEWEISIRLMGDGWDSSSSMEKEEVDLVICQYPLDGDDIRPNLFVNNPGDPFYGFIRGNQFSLYKENCDNCPGDPNFGREMIIGTVSSDFNKMRGEGMGFDSNSECGGTWSYSLVAKRIGGPDSVTCDDRPNVNDIPCI